MTYSGYGHFDSDEWCGWRGELGAAKDSQAYGAARRRLAAVQSSEEEARLKAAATYGGPEYRPAGAATGLSHQHFGPVLVSCDNGDVRPVPDGVWVYGDAERRHYPLEAPRVPRVEVVDELLDAVVGGHAPLHDGRWARSTLEVCLALLRSAQQGEAVTLGELRSCNMDSSDV